MCINLTVYILFVTFCFLGTLHPPPKFFYLTLRLFPKIDIMPPQFTLEMELVEHRATKV